MTTLRRPTRFLVLLFAATAWSAGVSGCGGNNANQLELSGNATFDGEPIVYGQLEFIPDKQKGHPGGPAATALIKDGKYDMSQPGHKGIVPGPHQVRVTAYPENPDTGETDETKETGDGVKPIFSGYTVDADLTSATYDFKVPKEAKGYSIFSKKRR